MLKGKSFETIMEKMKSITNEINDPDILLETAFDFSLSRKDISKLELEYADLVKNKNDELKVMLGY